MVHTRAAKEIMLNVLESSTRCGRGQAPRANTPLPLPPHPSISLEQPLATQYDMMRLLMENEMCRWADQQQPRQEDRDSSYSDFLVTQPPVFAEVTDPLEADNWRSLCTPLNNSEAQLELGALPTPPHYLRIIKFHGASSTPPSMLIIYLWVCSIAR
jgi:hypothetical protein